MTRIATNAASQSALMDLMRAQRSVFEAQQQLSTGKAAQDLKGMGHRAETLTAAYAAKTRAGAYEEAAVRTSGKLEVTDLALGKLSEATTDLRLALTTTDGSFVMDQVQVAFEKARNAMLTQHGGAYIFGGTRGDTNPFNATTLADLAAAADINDVFDNSARRTAVKLDDNITVETGFLADEVGRDLFAAFKRITEFDAGANGPFDGPMDATQQAYIQGEITNVLAAFDRINDRVAENGARQSQVENLATSQKDKVNYLDRLIGGIEDVDMADAAARLQQAQNAVEVSAATFSTLSQVSLLPFLR
tara:strand:+ start:1513 stop:2427 length:915 start_codon:yes stop_codon:yes gene_type:complete